MSPPADIKAGRGQRGDKCSACGWQQRAEASDDHEAHVVWSRHWQRYLCGKCFNTLLQALGRLRGGS